MIVVLIIFGVLQVFVQVVVLFCVVDVISLEFYFVFYIYWNMYCFCNDIGVEFVMGLFFGCKIDYKDYQSQVKNDESNFQGNGCGVLISYCLCKFLLCFVSEV